MTELCIFSTCFVYFPGEDIGKVAIWNMGPIKDEREEKDEGIPKLLCQMDNHLGMVAYRGSIVFIISYIHNKSPTVLTDLIFTLQNNISYLRFRRGL